jgi:hypothetical protein
MHIQIFEKPWKHILIEEYYDPILFENMIEEIENDILPNLKFPDEDNQILIYRNIDLIQFKNIKKCLYSKHLNPRLLKFFPNIRKYNKITLQKELVITGKYEYRIHDEAPHKIASMTTYVYPNKSIGTLLYNEEQEFYKEIPWKQNSSMLFAGQDNVTWHNYKNDKDIRVTINQFLIKEE